MAKIVIAEDDVHVIRVMTLWLTRHGHDVREGRTGREALARLGEETADILISDMNMPELNGLGLAKAVREELGLSIPILMLSSRCDQHELAEQTRKYGVQLYPKPFVPSRLLAEIDRLLAVAAT
jgi:two-component system chemotaxis response regulator CheY